MTPRVHHAWWRYVLDLATWWLITGCASARVGTASLLIPGSDSYFARPVWWRTQVLDVTDVESYANSR